MEAQSVVVYSRSYLYYDIEGRCRYLIGQSVLVRGHRMRIYEIRSVYRDGQMNTCYRAGAERYGYEPRRDHHRLTGLSLLGRVVKRAGEQVWLSLDIDGGDVSRAGYGWPWKPPTGNAMYLMPSMGTRVSLYFGGAGESSARGVNSIRENGGSMPGPQVRRLRSEQGKMLELSPKGLTLSSEVDESVFLGIFDGAVRLSGQRIEIYGKTNYQKSIGK